MRQRVTFECGSCGAVHGRWAGRCSGCGSWNSLEERRPDDKNAPSQRTFDEPVHALSAVLPDSGFRTSTGMRELDLVLGGGIVPGSFTLIAGEPGIGKSTLLLEIARRFKGTFYYFSGEESPAQVRLRADRMGLDADTVCFSADANLENILDRIKADKPDLVVVDSIQTIYRNRQSLPGSTSQLREAAVAFMEICKETCIPLIATGHITKDGVVAGPRLLEHMVDTVLYFESDRLNHLRLVRAVKNRFGPVGEVALFEMHAHGLSEHSSGQGLSVSMRGSGPGRVFSALTEGSRAIAVEVQALVCRAAYGPARRTAEGLDTRRLTILAAVMEKHVKVSLSDYDIFANLAGGLTSDEPALDLAIAAAVISSARDITVPADMAFLGEIGLSGEIRAVPRMNERIKELMNLGFRRICLPDAARPDPEFSGMDFRSVESVAELASAVSGITMHAVLPKAG